MEEQRTVTRNKGGRPKKAVKKDQILAVKCSLFERQAIEARAKSTNLTVSEYLREMAWAGVANFEPDIDETARSFADQLLGAGDAFAGDELQRSQARGFLEDMGKMRGTQFDQCSESFD